MLHYCNAFFEWELKGKTSFNHPIFEQLQFLPLLYAPPDEGLIVTAKPETCTHPLYFPDEPLPKGQKIVDWGGSKLIEQFAKRHQLEYTLPDWQVLQRLSSKLFSFERFPLPGAERIFNAEQLKAYLNKATGPIVVKDCLESSGRGHYFFHPDQPKEVAPLFQSGHPLIAEPWVERIQDFSTQWEITQKGDIHFLGSTICHNDALGKYRASEVGHPTFQIDPTTYEKLLEEIAAMGFFGNLGIDAMYYGDNQLQPVVEINPRKTMGFVALQFQKLHYPNQHLTLNFDNPHSPSLLPDSAVTKKGTRLKFRKTLSLELWKLKS